MCSPPTSSPRSFTLSKALEKKSVNLCARFGLGQPATESERCRGCVPFQKADSHLLGRQGALGTCAKALDEDQREQRHFLGEGEDWMTSPQQPPSYGMRAAENTGGQSWDPQSSSVPPPQAKLSPEGFFSLPGGPD